MVSWRRHGWNARRLAVWWMLAAIAAWLWPIGFGGRMPVGGDVTQFALGPLSVLGRALRSGRLPLWNDLWGYGFPGVGESQMGVYYVPHWFLYGLFEPERAFTASLVVHTLWGGLGAYCAGRRFGASEIGSALGGFAFATCGFFVIHLPHHWAATTGSWMPWAWGLAWSVLRGDGKRREPFLLAIVLTLQLLAGHFQLAFCTQVGVFVLAIEQVVEIAFTRSNGFRGVLKTLAALGGSFFLAGAQLGPTLRLARLAGNRRDFEYLSGFAASPLHLVTFLTPGLFERSPLWRTVVWDPFHTSPEEFLGFVGVVPLFLMLAAIGTEYRRSPAVRALTALAVSTLLLGLGPYEPGFEFLCVLPGFSFFRAPARWILATSLAFCVLAALGFDGVSRWRRPVLSVVRFTIVGVAVPALVVVTIELAFLSTERPGWPAIESLFVRVFDALPWHEPSAFARIVRSARRPFLDHRVEESWARQGVRLDSAPRPVFAEQRAAIYRDELTGSAVVFGLLLGLAVVAKGRTRSAGLVVLTVLDLLWLGHQQRRVDLGPIRPLAAQSPVLASLAREPHGTRTIDSLRNMPMIVGAAPVSAYRTLDLPALGSLTALASQLPVRDRDLDSVLAATRATGAGVRIFTAMEFQEMERQGAAWLGSLKSVHDPALAGWLFGQDWVAQQGRGASTFRIGKPPNAPARAWRVPLTGRSSAVILDAWSGNALEVLAALKEASPLEVRAIDPEHRLIAFRSEGDELVIVSELADPQWQAEFLGANGEKRTAVVARAFGMPNQGAWQAVIVPGPGRWTLRLRYRAVDVYQGLMLTGVSFTVWAACFLRYGRGATQKEGEGPE